MMNRCSIWANLFSTYFNIFSKPLFLLLLSVLYFQNSKRLVLYKIADVSVITSNAPFNVYLFSNTNSDEWLHSVRLANIADPLLDPKTVYDLISYKSSHRFAQLDLTLCSQKSRFVGSAANANIGEDRKQEDLSDLAFRLLFLGIHHHQHRYALKEMERRRISGIDEMIFKALRNNTPNLTSIPGIYDYECPNAKFLVSAVPGGTGLGHAIRKGAVQTMKAAMASNRVALFVNAARVGPEETQSQWTMASCDRHDSQCFFMPLSPCTITEKDLQLASVLNMEESRSWGTSKHVVEQYNSSKVVVMRMHEKYNPTLSWPARMNHVMNSIVSFADTFGAGLDNKSKKAYGLDMESLELVKTYLQEAEKKDPWIFDHATTLYILRPNPTSAQKIKNVLRHVFPSNFDPTSAIGIPIRSSDKCIRESECLTFDQYMQIVRERFSSLPMKEGKKRTVILTSESKEMLEARHRYNVDKKIPFTLIANDKDVAQGTGNPKDYDKMSLWNVTADDIMLSTLSSLNMQLMAATTVGNCCSNFHKLMEGLLIRGCGAAQRNHFECLQDNKNPDYRVCCQWSNNQECEDKKKSASLTMK